MLTSASVSALDVENTVLALWNEWLSQWFDGKQHVVGGHAPVLFPKAALRFQQSGVPQPMNGTSITIVWALPSQLHARFEAASAQAMYARVQFLFFVRAEGEQAGSGNPKQGVMNAAGLLHAILANPTAVRPLAGKGIHHTRPGTPQLVTSAASGSMRLVPCAAQLRYNILLS